MKAAGVTIFSDRAVFEDPHTLLLVNGQKRVTADKILIATGNRPTREMGTSHVIPGGELCITSNEAFHLEKLPKRILMAGGGYIALEFAHIFHGLGSHVSLVYRGEKPLRGFDNDMRDALCESMKARGLEVLLGCEFTKVEKRGNCLHAETNKGATIECDQILLAIGRQPNTDALHVEKAGVELGKKGEVKVDDYSRTSAPAHLCHGRRHRPGAADAGRDPRSDVLCRDRVQEQSHQARPCPCAQRRLHHAGAGGGIGMSEEKALGPGPQHRRLQIQLPSAAAHAGRAAGAHPDEDGGGCLDRQSAGRATSSATMPPRSSRSWRWR